jgi:hypothetical protein
MTIGDVLREAHALREKSWLRQRRGQSARFVGVHHEK